MAGSENDKAITIWVVHDISGPPVRAFTRYQEAVDWWTAQDNRMYLAIRQTTLMLDLNYNKVLKIFVVHSLHGTPIAAWWSTEDAIRFIQTCRNPNTYYYSTVTLSALNRLFEVGISYAAALE